MNTLKKTIDPDATFSRLYKTYTRSLMCGKTYAQEQEELAFAKKYGTEKLRPLHLNPLQPQVDEYHIYRFMDAGWIIQITNDYGSTISRKSTHVSRRGMTRYKFIAERALTGFCIECTGALTTELCLNLAQSMVRAAMAQNWEGGGEHHVDHL